MRNIWSILAILMYCGTIAVTCTTPESLAFLWGRMGCAIFLLATGIPLLIAMVWGTGTVWGRILLITCVLVMGVHLAAALSLNLFLNLLFSGTSSISA